MDRDRRKDVLGKDFDQFGLLDRLEGQKIHP